jgi:hypothetical protein
MLLYMLLVHGLNAAQYGKDGQAGYDNDDIIMCASRFPCARDSRLGFLPRNGRCAPFLALLGCFLWHGSHICGRIWEIHLMITSIYFASLCLHALLCLDRFAFGVVGSVVIRALRLVLLGENILSFAVLDKTRG